MEIHYFFKKPHLDGYKFYPKYGYEYGVEISFWKNKSSYYEEFEEAFLPLMGFLIETWGANKNRFEFLTDYENILYRIYFKEEADQLAFKMVWGGEPDAPPVYDEDEDDEFF